MSSLTDLSEIVGFFSYSREDDEASDGSLSARLAIQRELSAQLGRSRTTFRLWQDLEAIAPGRLWEAEIQTAVEQAVFYFGRHAAGTPASGDDRPALCDRPVSGDFRRI
jgi:hypothetical protein